MKTKTCPKCLSASLIFKPFYGHIKKDVPEKDKIKIPVLMEVLCLRCSFRIVDAFEKESSYVDV